MYTPLYYNYYFNFITSTTTIVHRLALTLKPPAKYVVGPPFAAKTALTHEGDVVSGTKTLAANT